MNPSPLEVDTGMDGSGLGEFVNPIIDDSVNPSIDDSVNPSIDDSDIPIALWKGVRKCTNHPIGNYVSYDSISSSYRAFVSSLDSI